MSRKTHFISFGIALQLVQVLSCTIPGWMVDTWNDNFTHGKATITSSGTLTWHRLKEFGQPISYTCVDSDIGVLVWRSTEKNIEGKYVYTCMMYREYDSDQLQFYYFLLNGLKNPNGNGDTPNPQIILIEDANLKKCDVCSTTEGRDVTDYKLMSLFSFSTVIQPTFGQNVECPPVCEKNLTVYKTLLTNIIKKILSEGIKCDDHGNIPSRSNGQGGFERGACKCLRKLNKDVEDLEGSGCNAFLLSQK